MQNRLVGNISWMLYFIFVVLIGFLRPQTPDAWRYLNETGAMYEILKNHEWIGSHAVGTHGFLFKLWVALIFLITGKNLIVPVLAIAITAIGALWMFNKLIEKFFADSTVSLNILLASNFFFILSATSFLREMPAIFFLECLVYVLFFLRKFWLSGLLLLLVLDSKEYVFFLISPGVFLWHLFSSFGEGQKINSQSLLTFIYQSVLLWMWPALYLFLILYSELIPINMFLFYFFGKTEHHSVSRVIQSFEKGGYGGVSTAKLSASYAVSSIGLKPNTYLTKIFQPGVFTLYGISKIFIFSAIFVAISTFIRTCQRRWIAVPRPEIERFLLCVAFICVPYVVIMFARSSHGRYFIPIYPLVLILFVAYVRQFRKSIANILLLGLIFMAIVLEILLESKFTVPKAILNLVVFAAFLFVLLAYQRKVRLTYFASLYCLVQAILLGHHFYTPGQVGYTLTYGHFLYQKNIQSHISEKDIIATNDPIMSQALTFLRGKLLKTPEYIWTINENERRKQHLVIQPFEYTQFKKVSPLLTSTELKRAFNSGANKLLLFVPEDNRLMNERIHQLLREGIISQDATFVAEQIVPLRGRKLYIINFQKKRV